MCLITLHHYMENVMYVCINFVWFHLKCWCQLILVNISGRVERKWGRNKELWGVSQHLFANLFPIYRGFIVLLFSSELSLSLSQGFCHCLSHIPTPDSVSLLTQGALRRRQEILSTRFSHYSFTTPPKLTHKQANAHGSSKFPAVSPPRHPVD